MTTPATKTFLIGVIHAPSVTTKSRPKRRCAAENWREGAFWDRDDEPLDSEGPCNVRQLQPDGTFLKLPKSHWAPAPTAEGGSGTKPYSVLLLYPDYANDSGTETFYTFVDATDPIEAVELAERQALTRKMPLTASRRTSPRCWSRQGTRQANRFSTSKPSTPEKGCSP